MSVIIMMTISMLLTMILFLISSFFSKNILDKKESNSNFECGFLSQTEKNTQFSSQFFMIAILFLIFDVEITLLLPIFMSESSFTMILWNSILILLLLLLATILEWKMGMIEWTK